MQQLEIMSPKNKSQATYPNIVKDYNRQSGSRILTQPCFNQLQTKTNRNDVKPIIQQLCLPSYKPTKTSQFKKHSFLHTHISNFTKRISSLTHRTTPSKVSISQKQKQNILQNLHRKLKQTSRSKMPNLKPADKMMLKFERELKRIRKYQNQTNNDENHEKKDKLQIYTANVVQDGVQDNQNWLKYGEGIFVICDGHGSNGREVAKFVSGNLFDKCLEKKRDNKISKNCIMQLFSIVNKELQFSSVDIAFSGCSCILVVYAEKEVFVANLGDCHAIVKKQCKIQALSSMHTPNSEQEKERIQSVGGVIRQMQVSKGKFAGPMRVWAPGKNSWGPGIALTRAFGDKAARRYGIISEPEVRTFEHASNEHILVLGSKLIFEAMKPESIFNTIKVESNENRQKICQLIADQALKKSEGQGQKASIFIIFA